MAHDLDSGPNVPRSSSEGQKAGGKQGKEGEISIAGKLGSFLLAWESLKTEKGPSLPVPRVVLKALSPNGLPGAGSSISRLALRYQVLQTEF